MSKGPTRGTKVEAEPDLALAQAAPTRAAMAAVLQQLVAEAGADSSASAGDAMLHLPPSSGGVKREAAAEPSPSSGGVKLQRTEGMKREKQ